MDQESVGLFVKVLRKVRKFKTSFSEAFVSFVGLKNKKSRTQNRIIKQYEARMDIRRISQSQQDLEILIRRLLSPQ